MYIYMGCPSHFGKGIPFTTSYFTHIGYIHIFTYAYTWGVLHTLGIGIPSKYLNQTF